MSETEVDYMSLIDAEMSRLKGLLRVAERDNAKLHPAAKRLAEFFVTRTTNLVMMRCDFCGAEWARDTPQIHDVDCPAGVVLAVLASRPEGE